MGTDEFDGRSVFDITDNAFEELVATRFKERQTIEFKSGYVYKSRDQKEDNKAKLELLKDICSFANSGYGYLVIGIQDNGDGAAIGFKWTADLAPDQIGRSIRGLVQNHISDIPKISIDIREVSGQPLVIVSIPNSDRRPHMVTYLGSTIFVARDGDGKRCMTMSEIREEVRNDFISRTIFASDQFAKRVAADMADVRRSQLDILELIQQPKEMT